MSVQIIEELLDQAVAEAISVFSKIIDKTWSHEEMKQKVIETLNKSPSVPRRVIFPSFELKSEPVINSYKVPDDMTVIQFIIFSYEELIKLHIEIASIAIIDVMES